MRKLARIAGVILLSLLLAMAGLWSLSRLLGPTDEQEIALAMLESPVPPSGENAFAALWLLAYDVPANARAALVAEDGERIGSMSAADADTPPQVFEYAAEGRFPNITPSDDDRQKFCSSAQPGCLEKVHADPEGYAHLLAKHARLVEQAADLRRYGHLRTTVPLRADMPLPPFQLALAPLTRNAADFAAGRVDAGLSGVCENAAAWRRIGADSDMLIVRMIGIGFVAKGYARLFADMLAELPADYPLPEACKVAFAVPTQKESSLCRAMQGESRFVREGMAASMQTRERTTLADWYLPILYSRKMTEARMAPEHAYACSREVAEAQSQDRPVPKYVGDDAGFDCIGNPFGCVLAGIGAGDGYAGYIRRAQDYSANLRLVSTLLWLREQANDGKTPEQALRERPQSLVAPGHTFEIADGKLRTAQFEDGQGATWALPLPASRMPAASGSR